MQCSKCGADVRSGMVECPQCGAPASAGSGTPQYRPGGNAQSGYVPGGGLPKQPEESESAQPPQRPLGSLQRRLQRSQASAPNDYDDDEDDGDELWSARPPSRGGDHPPHARPNDGPRRGQARPGHPSVGDGYGDRGQRSRPATRPPRDDESRYGSRGPASRGRAPRGGYDDESREAPAYSGGNRWDDESRNLPAQRGGGDRYRPSDDSMEMSAEMSVEAPAYPPARRPTSRRGSRPVDGRRDEWGDYADPMKDPRAPIPGGPSRRPSQGGGPGRRGIDDYDASRDARPATRRPADSYAGYTDGDLSAPGYTDFGDSYGGYPNAARDSARSAGRDQRGRGGSYPPPRGRGEYTDFGAPVAAGGWGESNGYTGEYSGLGDSAWQPAQPAKPPTGAGGKSRVTGRGGSSQQAPKAKRKRGLASTLFWMFTMLVMAGGLGVEVGPQIYHLAQRRGLVPGGATQTTTTCGAEATPGASLNPPAGSTAFATTAYTLAYPSSWQKNAQSGSSQGQCDVVFAFSQPNSAAKLSVEQAGAFASLTDAQVIAAEAQSAQAQGSSFSEITSAASTQTIGGEVWQRHEYQVTLKDGTKLHLALLAGHHKGAGFAIILLSSDAGFASDDTTSFEPVLKSFQFV